MKYLQKFTAAVFMTLIAAGCSPQRMGDIRNLPTEVVNDPEIVKLELTPSVVDFGNRILTTVGEKLINVKNTGNSKISLVKFTMQDPFGFTGGEYPGTNGTCGLSLDPKESCSIDVQFNPSALGQYTTTVKFNISTATSVKSFYSSLTGVGVSKALLNFSLSSYDFGSQILASSKDLVFDVTNTGETAATNFVSNTFAGPFVASASYFSPCGAIILPGESCKVSVSFTPSVLGSVTKVLSFNYNDGLSNNSSKINLTGTGVADSYLAIVEGNLIDFGSTYLGSAKTQTITLKDVGAAVSLQGFQLTLTSPFQYVGGAYPGTGGTCGSSLSSNLTCTLNLQFSPTLAQTFTDNVAFSYFTGSVQNIVTTQLKGLGVSLGTLTYIESPTVNFGSVTVSSTVDKTINLKNTGGTVVSGFSSSFNNAFFGFKGGTYPGTGGNCGTSLAPSAACSLVVTFMPTTKGSANGILTTSYNDGVSSSNSVGINLNATALSGPAISFADASHDFGSVAVLGGNSANLTVQNTGETAGTLTSNSIGSPFSFEGGNFPGTGGTCTSTIAPNSTCTVKVDFVPVSVGLVTKSAILNYNSEGSAKTANITLTGTGVSGVSVAFEAGSAYDFGNVIVGSTASFDFKVKNYGTQTAQSLLASGLAAPFSITNNTCMATLASGAECTISVKVAPTLAGSLSSTLNLDYNDGAQNKTSSINLVSTAKSTAALTISDGPTYNYGNVTSGITASKTFTVTNTGDSQATSLAAGILSNGFSFKGGTYPGTGGTCSLVLAGGATCTVSVDFLSSSTGAQTSSLALSYNNGVSTANSSIGLTSNVKSKALLTLSVTPLDFGAVYIGTAATTKTVTISNTGATDATSFVAPSFTAPFYTTATTCSTSLAAGSNCSVSIQYGPTAQGVHIQDVNFTYNDGASAQTLAFEVKGSAWNKAVVVASQLTYDFGSLTAGNSAQKTFTFTNTGGIDATAITETGAATPFSVLSTTCGGTLTPAANCTVTVQYAPTSSGTNSGKLDLNYNDGASAQVAEITFTANALTAATLAFDLSNYDFGTVTKGATSEKTVTVTNNGQSDASSIVFTGVTSTFSYKGGTYPGTGGTCGTLLPAGVSCYLTVVFTPVTRGIQTSNIQAQYYSGTAVGTANSVLTGNGTMTNANLVFADGTSYNFPAILAGNTEAHSFTVTNNGQDVATIAGANTLTSPFSFTGGTYPGTAGTCGPTLASGATCVINATYSPSTAGTNTSPLTLSYNNGVASVTSTITLNATSNPTAVIIGVGGPTINEGTAYVNVALPITVTLQNTSTTGATAISYSALGSGLTWAGGTAPGTAGTCGATLAASSTCTLKMSILATATGTFSAGFSVNYNNGVSNSTTALTITANVTSQPKAILSLNSSNYDYGTVYTNVSASKTLTLTNTGNAAATSLTIASSFSGGFTFKGGTLPGTGGTCGTTLAASASCTYVVDFSSATVGAVTNNLTLNYNDSAAAQSLTSTLTANVVNQPRAILALNSNNYDYGNVFPNVLASKTLTLTNSGNASATGLNLSSSLSGGFTFKGGTIPGTGGTCGATLASSSSCTYVVDFSSATIGSVSNNFTLSYNDSISAQSLTSTLTAAVVAPASISSDASSYNFGVTYNGNTNTKAVTLTNNSASTAATALAFSGTSTPLTILSNTCGTTLAANSTCVVTLKYAPTSTGSLSQTLSLSYSTGVTTQTLSLSVLGSSSIQPGTIDTTFGRNGYQAYSVASSFSDWGLVKVINVSDKIYGVGHSGTSSTGPDMSVFRNLSNGTLDTTYTSSGYLSFNSGGKNNDYGQDVAVDSSGNVYVVGSANNNQSYTVAKTNSTGVPDSHLGGNGMKMLKAINTEPNSASGVRLTTAGLFVAGTAGTSGDFFVTKLSETNAGVDTSFGGTSPSGYRFIDFGANDVCVRLGVQSTNNLILGGYAYNSSTSVNDMAFARVTPTGSLDTTFGASGKAKINFKAGNNHYVKDFKVLSDDSIIVIVAVGTSAPYETYLVKLTAAGALDSTFNTTGYADIGAWGADDSSNFRIAVQSDGKYLVAGNKKSGSIYNLAVARYLTTGAIDSVFGTSGTRTITAYSSNTDTDVGVAVLSTGAILVYGRYDNGSDFGGLGIGLTP